MGIRHLAFLTPGNHSEADPGAGLEDALRLFAWGESLGYHSAWVRQRHLERGVSSAATFLAAASQRTRRIELGSAVIQMGYESPFRLAEDLATADALSGGRLQIGLSAGAPPLGPLLGDRLFDADPATIDFSHARIDRLRDNLRGEVLGDDADWVESPAGRQRPRVQPLARGLAQRLWYGGGSLRSAQWAGAHGFHLLVGNLNRGELSDDFFTAQRQHIDTFRAHWAAPQPARIAVGRVIVPTDGADAISRRRFRAFAEGRRARTLAPQGERRTLFAHDLVGSSEQILASLARDPILPLVDELRLELPYDFAHDEYAQILEDVRHRIAPALGWTAPAATPGPAPRIPATV